ncbi:MAG: DUF5721 family protein [Lachnospiraceae bacterium]|nr:DUF5721 family protein [Lachnospiraceae bacterium]
MISIQIKDIGQFMTILLSESSDAFDDFLVGKVTIVTGVTYMIDGHLNREFYTKEEIGLLRETAEKEGQIFSEDMIRWTELKPRCYSVIKGKKAPLSFRFELYLPPEGINRFLTKAGITDLTANDLAGLSLNIKYGSEGLNLTTAVSYKTFIMDRTADKKWDEHLISMLDRLSISFTEAL